MTMSQQEVVNGLADLCENVKQLLPEELGDEAWYLLVVCDAFQSHTTSMPNY